MAKPRVILRAKGFDRRALELALAVQVPKKIIEDRDFQKAVNRRFVEAGRVARSYYEGALDAIGQELKAPQVSSIAESSQKSLQFGMQVSTGDRSEPFNFAISSFWPALSKTYRTKWKVGRQQSKVFWRKTGTAASIYQAALERARPALSSPKSYVDLMTQAEMKAAFDRLVRTRNASISVRKWVRVPHLPAPLDRLVTVPFMTGNSTGFTGAEGVPNPGDLRKRLVPRKAKEMYVDPPTLMRLAFAEQSRPWVRKFSAAVGQRMKNHGLAQLPKAHRKTVASAGDVIHY